jgi:hypothetical protein
MVKSKAATLKPKLCANVFSKNPTVEQATSQSNKVRCGEQG